MRSAIPRIQRRIDDLEAFDPSTIRERWGPEVSALQKSIEETLERVFGAGTIQFNRNKPAAHLDNGPIIMGSPASPDEILTYLREGKKRSIILLKQIIRGFEEELSEPSASVASVPAPSVVAQSRKVFVVHGRDNESKNEVARFLERIGLEVVILHERPNLGRHLLTKFQDEAGDVAFAVVLITPDDEGSLVGDAPRKRARQNVVFELGFFIGKLGPARVVPLVKGDIERPSDFDGVGYIPLDPTGGWKVLLARELRSAGIPFDSAKAFES